MPSDPNAKPPPVKHEALAFAGVAAGSFYGECLAGDYRSDHLRASSEEAKADVAEHLAEQH